MDLGDHRDPQAVQVAELMLHRAPGDAGILGDAIRRHRLATAVGKAADGDVEQACAGLKTALVQLGAGGRGDRGGYCRLPLLLSAGGLRRFAGAQANLPGFAATARRSVGRFCR
ncbi:hypothetical protein MBOE_17950 [Mycolicibacterium boenickei]|uniref:Transcriptional regulator n=1 Tax=Mycolicibacterium boenickei TaxID=146017 RepID=A0ABN5ZAQ6_9MYCO|nr:hypothetical protein MBOE_17950 [Mycolicibacterium boenickei]